MITQVMHSWVCWAILLLAIYCYQALWQQYLLSAAKNGGLKAMPVESDTNNASKSQVDYECTAILIGALPLMGLLGTIVGLLDCFASLASDGASSAILSNGIGDALLTTQLGLVCAIPAWILQGSIRNRLSRQHAYIAMEGQ